MTAKNQKPHPAAERPDPFSVRVYTATQQIPKGKVSTYARIAILAGTPGAARAVGNALHHNPDNSTTPCHRVVNSQGHTSCAFAFGGHDVQRDMLESEGVTFRSDGTVDLAACLWPTDPSATKIQEK